MKKYLMTALVLVASASLFTASAASKKKNVKKVTPVVLASEGDSLSYAAGVYATRGLVPFIQQSYQVDTAYARFPDFKGWQPRNRLWSECSPR